MKHLIYILFFLLGCSFLGTAQDEMPSEDLNFEFKESRYSIRGQFGVPNAVMGEVFRKKFVGSYEGNFNFQVRVYKHLFCGVGYKNGLMSISNRVPVVLTKLRVNAPYARIGINKIIGDRSFSTFAINAGYTFSEFVKVQSRAQGNLPVLPFASAFVEPEISYNLCVAETFAFYGFVNCALYFIAVDKDALHLQDYTPVKNLSSGSPTGIVGFGFGFYYGFKKRRQG